MYNLLVTAQKGAWKKAFYEYDTSRFLEYTNENIAKAFGKLTPERIGTLKSLPCVFAYEGTKSKVRVGFLKSIKEKDRSIVIEHSFHPDIPPIRFSAIQKIALGLDIRAWEMNRTHWAIKDEDLFERLLAAHLIKPSIIGKTAKSESLTRLRTTQSQSSKITTVQGFINKVLLENSSDGFEVFYRGHSDKNTYKLEPSLFRKDDHGNYLYLHNEHILYRELIVSNSIEFTSDDYTLDRLVRMQHYSLPTRLLDITSNPLIALYFACKSKYGTKQDGEHIGEIEGEVISLSLKRDQIKYFDSDTASCIANLARLPKGEKDKIDLNKSGIKSFNNQIAVKRLTHFVREEKPFFEPRIVPKHLRSIVCVKGKRSNNRISSQSGAFLLFGLDAVLDERGTPDIKVTRIAVANKANILRELDLLNINESSVFPYIENSARYVAQKYAFDNSMASSLIVGLANHGNRQKKMR